jgi:hypothetical protein
MNRFIGSLAIVTTLSYHNFEIAITITQTIITLSDKIKSSTLLNCLERSFTTNSRISFYRLSTDRIENTSSDVLLEGMFTAQLPSNKL